MTFKDIIEQLRGMTDEEKEFATQEIKLFMESLFKYIDETFPKDSLSQP